MATTTLRRAGGSSITTVPSLVSEFLNVTVGDQIEWTVEDSRVIVQAAKKETRVKPRLSEMLDAYEAAKIKRTDDDNVWLNSPGCGKELL